MVYCAFRVYGDGDSYTSFDFLFVTDTVESAIKLLPKNEIKYVDCVHSSMNENNNYVYVGSRQNCRNDCASFGGYVIEENPIKTTN
jgi:hypothetical protein